MENPRYYCTYFDRQFLSRGLALHASLERHCPAFHLWVLCLDDETLQVLTNLALPNLTAVALQTLEEGDAGLLTAKRTRAKVEYYFTCTASWSLWLLDRVPEINLITYLDADLYFFADPEPLFKELGHGSIAIISHRFSPALRHLEDRGVYNVGWVSFRRSAEGLACLNDWRERCLEWCHDRVEPGRFGDQKYLDEWPSRFAGVVVLQHAGANVAPWNLTSHALSFRDEQVFSNDEALLFFHFHGLRHLTSRVVNPNVAYYRARITPVLRKRVLVPYLEQLSAITNCLAHTSNQLTLGARMNASMTSSPLSTLKRSLKVFWGLWCHTLMRDPTSR